MLMRPRCRRVFGIWILGFGILVLAASGCAKARAESVPDGPPLQVPEPPQRVLAPVEEPLVVTTPAPEVEPPVVAAPPRATPARPAPEPKPQPASPPPAAAAAPPSRAPAETRELRPASPTTASERSIRELLARAARDLGRVDYGRLTADGRTQYEQSKRFSMQAEQALRERNLVFAATLADKAATLAAELLPR